MFKHIKSFLYGFSSPAIQNSTSNNPNKDSHVLFFELIKRWPEIVGEKLATHTIPLKNTQKTLTILTDHPQWAQELSFLESKIKTQIYKKIPSLSKEIQKFKFQADNLFFKNRTGLSDTDDRLSAPKPVPARPLLHPYSPEYRESQNLAKEMFQDVEDEELKELLTSIFINHRHYHKTSL